MSDDDDDNEDDDEDITYHLADDSDVDSTGGRCVFVAILVVKIAQDSRGNQQN